jgi:hypothetical protein
MTVKAAFAQWKGAFLLVVVATTRPALAQNEPRDGRDATAVTQSDGWQVSDHPLQISSPDVTTPDSPFQAIARTEQTLVPLPPAGWTGLVGLIGMGVFRARKAIRGMFS